MKRDWDLIRKILTDIEDDSDVLKEIPEIPRWGDEVYEDFESRLNAATREQRRIATHLEMLIESGYIDGISVQRGADLHFSFGLFDPRLTMAGHDLLDTMRSSSVWQKIKDGAKQKGLELTFDVIKALAKEVIKSSVSGALG